MWPLRRGFGDPTMREERDGTWWRATSTPEGPATMRLAPSGATIVVHAWGPGASWALDTAADLVGARDSLDGFDPPPGPVRELHRRLPGLRITRSRRVFEALVPSVIEQKIAGREARRSYRDLVRTWGRLAPGPVPGLMVPPTPDVLAAQPYYGFHRLGIEMRRARVISSCAARAGRLEGAAAMPAGEALRRLTSFAGIGRWTAAEVAVVALGDPDAVSVGDFHLPHAVGWLLAGEPRGDDARMLELLEPFAGHRGRVLRLISAAGGQAPRFGPRQPLRSIRRL